MKPRTIITLIAALIIMCGTYVLYAVNPPEVEGESLITETEADITGDGTKMPVNESVMSADYGQNRKAIVMQSGQHYFKDGVYHAYDTELKPGNIQGYSYEVENRIRTLFNTTANKPYRLEKDGYYVEIGLTGAGAVNAGVASNRLYFSNALPHIDREVVSIRDGVKESLILKNASASPTGTYELATNLTPALQADYTVRFFEGEETIFVTAFPKVYDDENKALPFALALRQEGGNYYLDYSVTTASDSMNAAFPVVIDPSSYVFQDDTTQILDNPIREDIPNWNQGTDWIMEAEWYSSNAYRILLEFAGLDTYIPSGSTIDSAYLDLYPNAAYSPNETKLYRITKDWVEGMQSGGPGVSNWDTASTGVPWDSSGGSYYDSAYATHTSTATGDWHTFDVTTLVQYWVSYDSNHGMLLRQADETNSVDTHHGANYFSSDYVVDTNKRPRLRVYYTAPPDTTTDTTEHIKYSSDYATLQEAVDSTRSGDLLYIDRDYTLYSTVEIKERDVTIIGTKSLIQPASNGSPSPLLRITNPNSQDVSNIVIKNLYIDNGNAELGTGTGTAIEIFEDTISIANISQVKLEDLKIQNFYKGIHVRNAHNILIENCWVTGNHTALRCGNTYSTGGVGQIKVFGGYFINNQYHIDLKNEAPDLEIGGITLYGWTCGHQRNYSDGSLVDSTNRSVGIRVADTGGQIFSFGCHYEELDYAIKVEPSFTPGVNMVGNTIVDIRKTGIHVQGGANQVAVLGNSFKPDSARFLHAPTVYSGMLVGANYRSVYSDSISENGLFEFTAIDTAISGQDTTIKYRSAFRVPIWNQDEPQANFFPKGVIFYSDNDGHLYYSDGSVNWQKVLKE